MFDLLKREEAKSVPCPGARCASRRRRVCSDALFRERAAANGCSLRQRRDAGSRAHRPPYPDRRKVASWPTKQLRFDTPGPFTQSYAHA